MFRLQAFVELFDGTDILVDRVQVLVEYVDPEASPDKLLDRIARRGIESALHFSPYGFLDIDD
jgi:uncharacterized protein (UPF0371 family)